MSVQGLAPYHTTNGLDLTHRIVEEHNKEVFMERRAKLIATARELSDVERRIEASRIGKKKMYLTLQEVGKYEEDTPTYVSVGRMFLAQPLPKVKEQLGEFVTTHTETVEKMEKRKAFLIKKMQEEEKLVEEPYCVQDMEEGGVPFFPEGGDKEEIPRYWKELFAAAGMHTAEAQSSRCSQAVRDFLAAHIIANHTSSFQIAKGVPFYDISKLTANRKTWEEVKTATGEFLERKREFAEDWPGEKALLFPPPPSSSS